jgi:glycosyltransferase involved in cell wall biosynthesis
VVIIGWIGSPATAHFLRIVAPVLEKLRKQLPIRCVAIGARADQVQGTPFEALPWSESTEAAMLQQLDVGIMPLSDTPFERGKCGYKLIQYMACGVPVVASPVGVNTEIVSPDVGFLATGEAQWTAAFEALIRDGSLRERLGTMGRRRVRETYSLQVQAPRFIRMLRSLTTEAR